MTQADIRTAIHQVLEEHFKVPRDKLTDDASFRRSLGLDSLDVVDFVFFLGDALEFEADLEDFRGVETLGQLTQALHARMCQAA